MSDGSLSQEEIDALLQGAGGLGFGSSMQADAEALSDFDKQQLQQLMGSVVGSQASNLSMLIGKQVIVKAPQVEISNRESFLKSQTEELVEIRLDLKDGINGEHLYVLEPDTSVNIAGLMMGQDDVELNEAAISALQESLSQFFGPASTAIGDRIGSTVMTEAPEGQFVPKAMVGFPQGEFVVLSYPLTIEGSGPSQLKEIFSLQAVQEILQSSGGSQKPAPQRTPAAPARQPQQQQQNGFGAPMGGMQQFPQQNFGMQNGMMNTAMSGMGAPNVQSVQFANLSQQHTSMEQGNISLLMDVYMEMTVELGRTKKLIKEILGMGEGTIIELDKLAGEPVDILVNHKLIAKGEVVVIDENFGVRVTEIVSPMERMRDMT